MPRSSINHGELPPLGQGREHGQESLPPTLQAAQTVAGMILTWVTAEFLVGSLDQLERDVTSKLK